MQTSALITKTGGKHWNDIAVSIMKEIKQDRAIKLFIGLVDNYQNLPRKRYNNDFAIAMRRGIKTSEGFIKYVQQIIKTETRAGKLKYTDALQSNPGYDEKTLIQMCKYIALCMTGQINPKLNNWYDNTIKMTLIDWDKPVIDKYMNSINLQYLIEYIVGIREVI